MNYHKLSHFFGILPQRHSFDKLRTGKTQRVFSHSFDFAQDGEPVEPRGHRKHRETFDTDYTAYARRIESNYRVKNSRLSLLIFLPVRGRPFGIPIP